MVHELERKLAIEQTWEEGDSNWVHTAELANTQQYRRCLDKLQQLVVSRIFELGKMNRSGTGNSLCNIKWISSHCYTGYKLRQHIAKALKSRSQAIKQALQRFNDATKKLKPPRETLHWEEVVDYTFLSEFDILANTQEDVRKRQWARPAAQILIDQFFKIQRANEEIQWLNVEIPRLIMFIWDEENFLKSMEDRLRIQCPVIAHQISHRRCHFKLANAEHVHHLQGLQKTAGFTGSLSPGKAQNHIVGSLEDTFNSLNDDIWPHENVAENEIPEDEDDDDEDEQEVELTKDLEAVFSVLSLEQEQEEQEGEW